MLDIIRDLKADGMTMVLATHEMGFAREVSSQVGFLDAGVICEMGPPEQIFGAPQEAADPGVPEPGQAQRPDLSQDSWPRPPTRRAQVAG